MRKILAASFLLFVAACNPSTPTPTPIPLADCAFTADGPTTIYTRPSLTADVFYEAPAGFTISEFQARTSDGWLGFDPGIAQAANTGPFRLRWIPPSAGTFSGDCSGLPVVWGPPPGVCFLMPMGLVDVHDMPDAAASVIDTLTVDDYVAIDGMNAAGWAHVDFSPGNTGLSLAGWVAPVDLNMNGPCDFTPPPACAFSAAGPTTIYTRPSLTADVFYEAPAGFTISEFQAQTSDGWLGFDPGIAQAANTGPFRLRWIPPTAATLSGDCSGLPVVWGPPPGVCFLMPMGPVDVHDMPDAAASIIATLTVDDYVAIDGMNAAGWAHVDFSPGNTGLSLTGWVGPADLNMNGPCDFTPPPACAFSAAGPTTIYTRPSLTADVFYEAPAGFTISEFQAQTSDGWLGFDPGIAQAANTGPFRLRWIPPTAATLSGDCSGLPVVWGPPPGVCFLMPMGLVDVHDMPDAAASIIATLTVDDYVAIDGVNAGGWAHVDFAPGNTGASLTGWVAPADLNMNGPCDFSATPTPVGAAISGFTPDTTQVYSGLGRCTPEQVTFNAHVADPSAVKVVVFFYRLQDVDSGEQSDWSTGQAMQQQGSGYYSLTLTGSELVGSSGFTHAHVRYQFALQPKSGAIVRSSVYDDVELAQCGIISLPALILVTPTPTPIIVK